MKKMAEESKLDANVIIKNIKTGIFEVVTNNEPGSSKSKVWEKFLKIKYTDKNKYIDFVQCGTCKIILTYNSKSGNSHLNRHQNKCTENLPKLDSFINISGPEWKDSAKVSIYLYLFLIFEVLVFVIDFNIKNFTAIRFYKPIYFIITHY